MLRLSKTKKIVVTLVVAGAVVAGSGAAYAYWTTTGSGNGTVTSATNAPITAVQTSVITTMAPGVAPQILSGNFTNPNSFLVKVATVTAVIGTPTGGTGGCLATDFVLGGTIPMAPNAEIPAGTAQGAWSGTTIAFNDLSGTNQDRCKGVTVPITYTVA